MLSIHCRCDSVAIEWPHKKVLWQLECCCNECTTRIQYLHAEKNGPKPPAHQLLDGVWLKNDFTILKGLEILVPSNYRRQAEQLVFIVLNVQLPCLPTT
jgi:hypothetical protein